MDDLKELVIQSLDANGVLDKIRAELRVSVSKAIENQQPTSLSLEKSKAANAVKTEEGRLCGELLRDFLDCYMMSYSLHVFLPEARLVSDCKGQALADKCGVQYEQDKPVSLLLRPVRNFLGQLTVDFVVPLRYLVWPSAGLIFPSPKAEKPQEDLSKVASLKLANKLSPLAPLPSQLKSADKLPPPRTESPAQDRANNRAISGKRLRRQVNYRQC
jgi:hypothetical protein